MTTTLRLTLTRALTAFTLLGGSPHPQAAEESAATKVDIENFTFEPAHLTVPVGTVVTWVNDDDVPHIVLGDDGGFTSPVLDTEDRYSFAFDQPGSYQYFCQLHPHMQGVIEVTPGPG